MCYSASSSGNITINNDIIRLRPKIVSIDPTFIGVKNSVALITPFLI